MPENKRTIGYLCPVCGKAVVVERSEFQLAASDSRLPCPCGKSELTIRQMGDHCEITVPCVCCAKDHTAACSNDALLHQRLMSLSCSASGLGCCYIGQEDAVFQAMEQLEQAVDKLVMDGQTDRRGAFLDEVVMGEVLGEVKEIAALRCVEVVTVKTQIKSLLRKFGCTRTKEIVATIRELNVAHLF